MIPNESLPLLLYMLRASLLLYQSLLAIDDVQTWGGNFAEALTADGVDATLWGE